MKNDRIIIAAHADRLAGSACADREGNLLVLHHATNRPFEAFTTSADMGFHFGARKQADKRRKIMISRGEGADGDPWRVVSCALAIRNPLVIADDPGMWGPRWLTATLTSYLDDEDREAIRGHADRLRVALGNSDLPTGDGIVREWHATLRNALKRKGYDGIVYRNVFESVGKGIEWSWVAFDDAQIIRLGDRPELETLRPEGFTTGAPPKLRGAGPMRHHQSRGLGDFIRPSSASTFRAAVEGWAEASGIQWTRNTPLDHEPKFGEAYRRTDLYAEIGGDPGYTISVTSLNGEVSLSPNGPGGQRTEHMARFRSWSSEGFYDQGTRPEHDESVVWRPAESIETFSARLAAVHVDFVATVDHEHRSEKIAAAEPRIP